MLSTWREARRVFVALLIFSMASLATACDSVTGLQERPAVEFNDQVLVEDGWTDGMDPVASPRPVRKELAE